MARERETTGDLIQERAEYFFKYLPTHLLLGSKTIRLRQLLLSFEFINYKVMHTGVLDVLADLEKFHSNADRMSLPSSAFRATRLLQEALSLSEHVLLHHPWELASQLVGRLHGSEEPAIQTIIEDARNTEGIWLRPTYALPSRPGCTLLRSFGHGNNDTVMALQYSADYSLVVTGHAFGEVHVWAVGSGQEELAVLMKHNEPISVISISKDGRLAVTGARDGSFRTWDLDHFSLLNSMDIDRGEIKHMSVSADSRVAALCEGNGTLTIWDLENQCISATLHSDSEFLGVDLCASMRIAVTASTDESIIVWDLDNMTQMTTIGGASPETRAIVTSNDGRIVAAGDSRGGLKVWRLDSQRLITNLVAHENSILSVAVSADGRRAATASMDRTAKVWDLETSGIVNTLSGHARMVTAVGLNYDGSQAITGSFDGKLRVWNVDSKTKHVAPQLTDWATDIAFFADGQGVMLRFRDGSLRILDHDGTPIRELRLNTYPKTKIAVDSQNDIAVFGSEEGDIEIWDLSELRLVKTTNVKTGITAMDIAGDHGHVVFGSSKGGVFILNMGQHARLSKIGEQSDYVSFIACTKDGQYCVSGSGELNIWNITQRSLVATIAGHNEGITDVIWTTDGCQVITSSGDRTVSVWDAVSGKLLRTTDQHPDHIDSIAVIENQPYLVAASNDTLYVWNIENGDLVTTFTADADITCIAAGGQTIAFGDTLGQGQVLRLECDKYLQ